MGDKKVNEGSLKGINQLRSFFPVSSSKMWFIKGVWGKKWACLRWRIYLQHAPLTFVINLEVQRNSNSWRSYEARFGGNLEFPFQQPSTL
jgi:hypothetical protein